MKKTVSLALIAVFLMLGSLMLNPAFAQPPLIKGPMELYTATIEGGNPETCDPAWSYDTASGELIFNIYETLIFFDGECVDKYIPQLATDVWIEEIDETSPEGLHWYYRYTFDIRGVTGIHTLEAAGDNPYSGIGSPMGSTWHEITADPRWFCTEWIVTSWTDTDFSGDLSVSDQIDMCRYCRNGDIFWNTIQYFHIDAVPPDGTVPYTITITEKPVMFTCGYEFTPQDVEYSIERELVQDRDGGPQWMFYEPLLDTWGADGLGDIGNCTHPGPDVANVGKMIDHAVESNSTHVWFNLAFPGAYAPFLQILCQNWGAVLSKQWVVNDVIGTAGRPDWNGEWGDYTAWICNHNPEVSPLDDPTPMMCGTGPFSLIKLDYVNFYWSISRNTEYWRGWPADFPAPPYPSDPTKNITPAGYIDIAKVTWAFAWPARSAMFLAGDVDFCAVPREYIGEIYGQPNIRCHYPLPGLAVGNLFFTFDIDPSTSYGKVNDYGVYTADGIPRDFFGSHANGLHTRRGFAKLFDSATYLAEVFLGEAIAPATAIIPGLSCYDPSVLGYSYSIDEAAAEFMQTPEWASGFTVTICYNTDNLARQRAAELIQAGLNAINAKYGTSFVSTVVGIDWKPYLGAMISHQLSCFIIGWLADYPDPHNFAFPFYHSQGTFAEWQAYNNPTMDAWIEAGIRESDPDARCEIYHDIQVLAVDDCPSIPLYDAIGRHFEQTWVVGYYYNIIYPGFYFYNLWKWYYCPHSTSAEYPTYPACNHLPYDVNYDGKVDMKDIGYVCKAYGSTYGPPIHPRWHFRCDVNNDRKIDMKDIGYVAKSYGCTSDTWAP